jgi:hypothetical protein
MVKTCEGRVPSWLLSCAKVREMRFCYGTNDCERAQASTRSTLVSRWSPHVALVAETEDIKNLNIEEPVESSTTILAS